MADDLNLVLRHTYFIIIIVIRVLIMIKLLGL
jgi:hypothetical protein